jgi:FAD/FMN-containing dehydrogenase
MKLGPIVSPWQKQHGARIGRRGFIGTTLAATALAAVHPGRTWATASGSAAIPNQLAALSAAGQPMTLSAADIKDLRSGLHGSLLLAQDAGYDSARRMWNRSFDRHPALIARCADAADVVRAVNFARAHDLRTAVRAGGHSVSGQSVCDGGLVIDVSQLRAISVDAQRQVARAQSGVLLGELDRATQAAGLATTLGTVTDTGIAGLTLGGGMGRLMRKHGLACDNLRSVDVVTADGKLRHASVNENPDLFWALRGGGGNFGVATSFEYRLHQLAHRVLTGERVYPFSQARAVFAAAAELADRAPDDLTLGAAVFNSVDKDHPGQFAIWSVDYCGDPRDGERLLEPLRKLGTPLLDTINAVSYLQAQGAAGAATIAVPSPAGGFVKSGFMRGVTPDMMDELLRRFVMLPPSMNCSAGLSQMGGAVARVSPEGTAFWNRHAGFDFLINGDWTERAQDQRNMQAIRDMWSGLEKFSEGYYVNTEPSEDEHRLRATYGNNYPRLVQLKNRYDPSNLFRLNANIKPTAAA